jgi:hypothetical protein
LGERAEIFTHCLYHHYTPPNEFEFANTWSKARPHYCDDDPTSSKFNAP